MKMEITQVSDRNDKPNEFAISVNYQRAEELLTLKQ